MRINEVRQREGLPPDEMGNELMASRDLLPLRIAVKTAGNAAELQSGRRRPEGRKQRLSFYNFIRNELDGGDELHIDGEIVCDLRLVGAERAGRGAAIPAAA